MSLSINSLVFDYPSESKTFYFSKDDIENVYLTRLNYTLFPVNIRSVFPDLTDADFIYTSFENEIEGFESLQIDFQTENFLFVKRYLNRAIKYYFSSKELLVHSNFVNDNQVWIKSNDRPYKNIQDCRPYDRFTLKINFNHVYQKPELILSYDRQAQVYKKSLSTFIAKYNERVISGTDDGLQPLLNLEEMLSNVVYVQPKTEETRMRVRIFSYKKLVEITENGADIDYNNVYPVVNNRLAPFFGVLDYDEHLIKGNPYKRYLKNINNFKKKYLHTESFNKILHLSEDFTELSAKQTSRNSRSLLFGKNHFNFIPQMGINKGPYKQIDSTFTIFFIYPKECFDIKNNLANYLINGYGAFDGIKKYTGVPAVLANEAHNIAYNNNENPIPEIETALDDFRLSNTKLIAIYISPFSKYTDNKKQRIVYYKVKEALLKRQIPSQSIVYQKMMEQLNADKETNYKTFAYTLQNISIAINAKLGGTPWRLASKNKDELVIGVGAFVRFDTKIQYIGSAFSFDNTGKFNSFEYFHKDEFDELLGSIENAIINYRATKPFLKRLIIHYFKVMRDDEVEKIEQMLYNIGVDVPLFIVSINKTESEDIIVFEKETGIRMPYSGSFVDLGNNTFLLCNNTRYPTSRFSAVDGFPFPVKLKIHCPTDNNLLTDEMTYMLIDQVYQFSRIYWKSIKQQNLPVTIKYAEMLVQIASHFSSGIPHGTNRYSLWFL